MAPYFIGGDQRRAGNATNADISRAFDDGATWWRQTFDLAFVAQNGNTSNPLAGIDLGGGGAAAKMEHAASLGMSVLATVTYCPTWLGGVYHRIPLTAGLRANWAAIFAALVDAHDDGNAGPVTAWEPWNEVNHDPFNAVPAMATIRPWIRTSVLAARAEVADAFIVTSGPASARSRAAEWTTRWDAGTATAEAAGLTPSISCGTLLDGWFGPPGVAEDGTGLDSGNAPGTAWASAFGIHGYTGAGVNNDPSFNSMDNPLWHSFRSMPNVGDTAVFGGNGFNFYDHIVQVRDPGKTIWQTEGGHRGGFTDLSEGDAANHMTINLAMWKTNQDAGKAGPYFNFEQSDNGWRNVDSNGVSSYQSGNPEDYLGNYRKTSAGVLVEKQQLAVWRAFNQAVVGGEPDLPVYIPSAFLGPSGTPRGARVRVPVDTYTARAYS